jgi:hypothetical protein
MHREGCPLRKLLVIQAAGLGHAFATEQGLVSMAGMPLRSMATVFPALTCVAQASFRTALPLGGHGMPANGFFSRDLHRVFFWEQSSALVEGQRIWSEFRKKGGTVGLLFWQQSLGESVDLCLSPAPIHRHHGGMVEDCYAQPDGLYSTLCRKVGRPFKLSRYWGPFASSASSAWIAEATGCLLEDSALAPDLCLTYLPALDYDLQRYGTEDTRSRWSAVQLGMQVQRLCQRARAAGYAVVLFGDYAIRNCHLGPVFPNRALLEAGLLKVRRVGDRCYADLHASRAFAVVDHEVALVHVASDSDLEAVRACLCGLEGIGRVLGPEEQARAGIRHAGRGGGLVVEAGNGHWLAYPWWRERGQAPDYARHVDIHNKPGYDPCELFLGWPPGSVSTDPGRIGGSHGRVGAGRDVGWASTLDLGAPGDLVQLAQAVRDWLNES